MKEKDEVLSGTLRDFKLYVPRVEHFLKSRLDGIWRNGYEHGLRDRIGNPDGCEYCRLVNVDPRKWALGDKVLLGVFMYVDFGYGERWERIKYCPNCGKKIEELEGEEVG